MYKCRLISAFDGIDGKKMWVDNIFFEITLKGKGSNEARQKRRRFEDYIVFKRTGETFQKYSLSISITSNGEVLEHVTTSNFRLRNSYEIPQIVPVSLKNLFCF